MPMDRTNSDRRRNEGGYVCRHGIQIGNNGVSLKAARLISRIRVVFESRLRFGLHENYSNTRVDILLQ